MKIAHVNFEIVRATNTVAEFVVHVELDKHAVGFVVSGVAIGPMCVGVSTVELPYPMVVTKSSDTTVSLRCVILEPNLWTADSPYSYAWVITVEMDGTVADKRTGSVVLKG